MLALSQILGKKKYKAPFYTHPAALMLSSPCLWSFTLSSTGEKAHMEGRPDGNPGNSQDIAAVQVYEQLLALTVVTLLFFFFCLPHRLIF